MFGYLIFLLAKKLDESEIMDLHKFFNLVAIFTGIIHIRTLFFLPKDGLCTELSHNDNVFNSSFIGSFFVRKNRIMSDNMEIKEDQFYEKSSIKLKKNLKIAVTKRFLLFSGIYLINLFRENASLNHFNPWLDYTFSEVSKRCSNLSVSINAR